MSQSLAVPLRSISPLIDPIVRWFQILGFWNETIQERVVASRFNLSPALVTLLRQKMELPLIDPTKALFQNLLKNENGIDIRSLGLTMQSWKDPDTCTHRLYTLKLVRIQEDEYLLKPINKIAFDPRVQYIVGVRPVPIQ